MFYPCIHFSIDDVHLAFSELFRQLPPSIFDVPLFARLKALHTQHGLKATLYAVGQEGGESMMDHHSQYRQEFLNNRDWLKFGLHCTDLARDHDTAFHQFEQHLIKLEEIVGKEAMTDTVRLHWFACTADALRALEAHGVKVLLCADDDRISYLLTADENAALLSDGQLQKDGMRYLRTAFRLEAEGDYEALIAGQLSRQCIPVFTHECFFYGPHEARMEQWLSRMLAIAKARGLTYCL